MRRVLSWRFLTIAIVALVLVAGVAQAQKTGRQYALQVDGLACPFCAYGVEKKLSATKDVKAIDIDIKSGTVTVTMTDGATLDEATARTAVKAAGFALGGFEEVPRAVKDQPKQ